MAVKKRKTVRAAHVIFIVFSVVATLFLAWWQWTRFRSGSGSFQNLGYALQWPFFGAAMVWGYRKYVKYETELQESEEEGVVYEAPRTDAVTEIDPNFLPARPTINVEQFNELNTPHRGDH